MHFEPQRTSNRTRFRTTEEIFNGTRRVIGELAISISALMVLATTEYMSWSIGASEVLSSRSVRAFCWPAAK
jgi:hypothetical protein